MKRALVVIDHDEVDEALLAEAGGCVQGTDADMLLLTTMSEESHERDVDTLNQIGRVENRSYRNDTPLKGAERYAAELAETALADDIEYTPVSRLVEADEEAEAILEVAEEYACDHVFLSGRKRSPTGKALFGDRTQAVLLNADAYVTVAMQ
jgi:nucleotide-binding universal stress UspA family protein